MPGSKPTVGQLTDRNAVSSAIAEFDHLGRERFLARYGFGLAKTWLLLHNGKQYDSKAIVGVALRKQLGVPVTPEHFRGGEISVVKKLRSLGFVVEAQEITEESVRLPEEVPETFPEGQVQRVLVDRRERSVAARVACIERYGHSCAACGIDFGETYGNEFEGLIHVHHLEPLAQAGGGPRQVDPARDLRPVCPNCHAAIHWRGASRQVEDIAAAVARRRGAV